MSNNSSSRKLDPSIVAAIIGVIGTIVVTLISINANRPSAQPTQTPIIIVATPTVVTPIPTDTVPPGQPTSTPAPDTPTPSPTFTFTPIPTLAAGMDWQENCISTAWKVFPETLSFSTKGGCYVRPLADVFSVSDHHFTVFFENTVTEAQTVGVLVELPSDSSVQINIHLDRINVGELWVGVFGDSNPQAKGLVIAAPQGNAKNSAFVVRTMPDGKQLFLTGKFKKDSGNYSIAFDVSPNTVAAKIERYTAVKPVSVPSENKWLFVGYRASFGSGNHIEGNFFDLVITPR